MISVFYSSQRAWIQALLKKTIKETFPEKDEMNYTEVDLTFSPTQEIVDECESFSFCSDKKVVVAYNAYFLGKSKTKPVKGEESKWLLQYLENPNPSVDLYFVVYEDSLNEKSEYYKLIMKTSPQPILVGTPTLDKQGWVKYIVSYFKKRNITIDLDAAYEFYDRFNGDYSAFMSYADKLISYAFDTQRISKREIEELVAAPLEEKVYEISNAICKGDKKTAFKVYQDQKVLAGNDVEIGLLTLLANQFRLLNEIQYLYNEENLTTDKIASVLKINPKRVEMCVRNLRNMNDKTCPVALENIYQAQKSILTGRADPTIAFSLFVTNFKLRP